MASRLDSQRERFEANPSDASSFQALEEHYFLEGSWESLVSVYEMRIGALDPADVPRERARVLFRFGQALEEGFTNLERASDCYREALELDPELEPARRRLRQIYLARGDWDRALSLLEQEATQSNRPERRIRLQMEIGELCIGEGGDPARAVEAYQLVLQEKPRHAGALVGRAKALDALSLTEDARRAWQEATEQLEGDEQAEAFGALLETFEENSDGAVEVYWRAHAARDQESRWIEGLAGHVAKMGRWDDAATLGEERIARAEGPERRSEIAIELGRLANEHLDDRIGARRWFAKAAEWHESAELHIALAELAVVEKDESLRASHLARAMELDGDERAVASYDTPPQPTEAQSALDALRERADAAPEDPGAQRALSEGLESAGLLAELVEVLERRLAFCREGSGERAALLYRIGEVRERDLHEIEAAADAYQLCFAVAPSHPGILDALERVLRGLDQLPELAALLEQASDAVENPERGTLLCALGSLQKDELDDAPRAIDAYAKAIEIDAHNETALAGLRASAKASGDPALQRRALEVEIAASDAERLETLVPSFIDLAREGNDEVAVLRAARRWADVAEGSRAALEALVESLSLSGDTEELVEVLGRLERCVSESERGAVRRRLGYLHAAEGRTEMAVDSWRAALEADPDDTASGEALVDSLWESGRPGDLLRVFEGEWGEGLRRTRDANAKYAAALEAGGRLDDALALHRELCAERPGDAERIAHFERVARSADHAEALVEALSLRAGVEAGAARESIELERAGILDTALHRDEDARAAYRALIESASQQEVRSEAEHALEALLERADDIEGLCDLLEASCPRLAAVDACTVHARIATLAETRLGDLGRARRHLESAVALRPEQGDLWRLLAELYDEETQPSEILRAVDGELAAQPDTARVLALSVRAARLCAESDPERAERYYDEARRIDPAESEACGYLVARYDETERSELAEALLRDQLTALEGDDAEIAAPKRNELRLALAERLGDTPDAAIELLESAMEECEGSNESGSRAIAERLAELYQSAGRGDAYRAQCERIAQACDHPAEASLWWERYARTALEDGARGSAVDAFERALSQAPRPEEIRATLIEIYREDHGEERLAELLEVELSEAPESQSLLGELADLYEGPLARPERALAHLETLTAIEPRELRWWERALQLAELRGDPERTLALLRGAAEFGPGARRADWLEQGAVLLRGVLKRPDEALEAYRDVLRTAPHHTSSRRALRELLFERGCAEEGLTVLESEFERAAPEDQLQLVETALALGGPELSAEVRRPWIARLQALAGARPHLLMRAATAYQEMGDRVACERALALAARGLPDGDALRDLHLERAALLDQDGAAARRIDALEAARRLGDEDSELLRQLDELYVSERRHRDLLGLLEDRITFHEERNEAAEVRALKRRMALLCTETLAEPGRAAALWCELLDRDAPEIEAPRRGPVGDILYAAREYQYWAPLAEAELDDELEGSPRWVYLRGRLAEAYDRQLGRPVEATRHYRTLADAGLVNDNQRRALLRLLLVQGAAGEWARRVEDHLKAEPADAHAWIALARVREQHLAHNAGAAAAYARAAELDASQSSAWSGLRRTSEALGAWTEVASAIERLIEQKAVPAGPSWRSLGEIALRRLGDPEEARRALLRAREIAADDVESLRLLREVAHRQDELYECADLFREEIELLGSAQQDARPLWLQLAQLAGGPLCDWERSCEAFSRADQIEELESRDLASWCDALLASGVSEGKTREWAEVFERWCDHADTNADSLDHERLARTWSLIEGQDARARRQIARALELDPNRGEAWVLAAELRGDEANAGEAWRRAAECSEGSQSARYYERAAAHQEADPESAWSLYSAASEVDPSSPEALAGLARSGAATGRDALSANAAEQLLSLEIDASGYAEALLAGARCAAACADGAAAPNQDRPFWEQARNLCDGVLASSTRDADALWIRGRARFALGDRGGARSDLDARLTLQPELPEAEQAVLFEQLGLSLAAAGERSAAIGRLREAVALDPGRSASHRGLTETLELVGRRGEAASAWATWAEASATENARERAQRFECAVNLCEGGDERRVTWLRAANEADASYAPTRLLLVEHLFENEQHDEALREAQEGIARLPESHHVSQIESLRGRILEKQRDLPGALEAYRRAIELNPVAMDDVRAAGRLLRGQGDWEGSAALLRSFSASCPEDTHCGEALLDLGRLMAGPLEDIPGAVEVYRRARNLAPEREDVRESLADLLAQFPEHRDEAVTEHRALLRAQPLRQRSLRALLTIAERESKQASARGRQGKALLAALGSLSSFERAEGEARLEFQIGRNNDLENEIGVTLQKAAKTAAPYCESLLPETEMPEVRKCPVDGPLAAFREAFFAAENESLGHGWLTLPPEALRKVLGELIRFHSGDSADHALARALEEAPGRVRRRLRKILAGVSFADLETFELAEWQDEIELQALSVAVDVTGGALRPALLFALAAQSENASLDFGDDVDLGPWLEPGTIAMRLFERALATWLDAF